jgi:NAD(P)-dependent dehydrogenase (short-subunit alcohol dehydrogenase family)
MDLEFTGKVIALTGASRGVGLAIAERLVAEGAAVAISALSAQELAEAHGVIEGHGGRCLAYACDLAVPGEAAAFIASVVEIFGRLDGLVCNATMATKSEGDREAWQAEMALNVGHAIEAIEAAAPLMHASGSIVLLASGEKRGELWPVAGVRGALAEAARHFSGELAAQDIRVVQLLDSGEGVADAAAFLLSTHSAAIRGKILP